MFQFSGISVYNYTIIDVSSFRDISIYDVYIVYTSERFRYWDFTSYSGTRCRNHRSNHVILQFPRLGHFRSFVGIRFPFWPFLRCIRYFTWFLRLITYNFGPSSVNYARAVNCMSLRLKNHEMQISECKIVIFENIDIRVLCAMFFIWLNIFEKEGLFVTIKYIVITLLGNIMKSLLTDSDSVLRTLIAASL